MGRHGPRRTRLTFSDSAARQLDEVTTEAEIHALDRALVAISVDPDIGVPIHASRQDSRPALLEYADEIEDVRIVYFVTTLRSVVVVAYIET
ncbi:hypothetical protein [Streptomyces sp. MST-110588]|uniref:hypothetical protein n=1 Tax=Streptomyces sp. MST-110588 TaxID=2833628 RepID=UPI001F5D3883|nr:hypothetical protein [Streptomyces sp. MST-110588]UNO43479.1 hypothetical protein KGS77_33375 [Streptomyces sp. MST-110588]